MVKKIIIEGKGGQGIKLISFVLANILAKLGKDVSLVLNYGETVRGGEITAYLKYSDEKIGNPIIEEADIMLKLSEFGKEFKVKKTICEKGLCRDEEIPFEKIALEKFGTRIVMNMVALGVLLKFIEVDVKNLDLKKILPEKFVEKNVEAIKYGYTYKD